ncbi:Zinc finger, C2H2 type [Plasmodiophora brassicae]|uniref:Uncharacterized protein n=1 Tax=Plasmodiophora brassicae TaxID=37360 RepID=A0A0G4IK49_PLABS|nr:hypothetical protein PBRA_004264 [Plasmodiophora brassicae]SPR00412.1 unnamed protein product [Plasmodiophora brassicae]
MVGHVGLWMEKVRGSCCNCVSHDMTAHAVNDGASDERELRLSSILASRATAAATGRERAASGSERSWCAVCESLFDEDDMSRRTCTGLCRRSFHSFCISSDPGIDHAPFVCRQCVAQEHACFQCGETAPDSELRHCSVRSCAKFFHQACWKEAGGGTKPVCGRHHCQRCVRRGLPVEDRNPDPVHRCIRCPKSWDLKCIPKGSFRLDFRPSTFLICPDHTPWPTSARLSADIGRRGGPSSDVSSDEDSASATGEFIPFDLPTEWTSDAGGTAVDADELPQAPVLQPAESTSSKSRRLRSSKQAPDAAPANDAVEPDAVNGEDEDRMEEESEDVRKGETPEGVKGELVSEPTRRGRGHHRKHSGAFSKKANAKVLSQCHYCDREFRYSYSRNQHERDEHPEQCPLQCPNCRAGFHSQRPLEKHLAHGCGLSQAEQTPSQPLSPTTQRSADDSSVPKLRPRRSVVYDSAPIGAICCDYCPKTFHQMSNLKTHERQCHPEQCPLHCAGCGAPFHSNVPLERHTAECEAFQRLLAVASDDHQSAASDVDMIDKMEDVDDVADDESMSEGERRPSNRLSHGSSTGRRSSWATGSQASSGQYPCSLCDRVFTQVSAINAHERNAHPEICPLHCMYCDKPFHTVPPLERHQMSCPDRNEAKETPPPAQPADMPIRIHLPGFKTNPMYREAGQFRCSFCSTSFDRRFALTTHEREVHPDLVPFRCPICGSGFSSRTALESHANFCMDHTCEECGRDFFSRHALEKHAADNGHNAGPPMEPIVCPHCSKTFKWQRSLDHHLVRVHKETPGGQSSGNQQLFYRPPTPTSTLLNFVPRKRLRNADDGSMSSSSSSSSAEYDDAYKAIDENVYVCSKPAPTEPPPLCECSGPGPLCVDDSCINVRARIECDVSAHECANQRFQRKEFSRNADSLSVVPDASDGSPCLTTTTDIPSGSLIVEFVGEVLDAAARRTRSSPRPIMLRLTQHLTVDATRFGNVSRFIQHCRSHPPPSNGGAHAVTDGPSITGPNCSTTVWSANGVLHIGVFAARDIAAGSKLTVDMGQSGRVAYDNVLRKNNHRDSSSGTPSGSVGLGGLPIPRAMPSPLNIYDRERLPSQMQFDAVVSYQLDKGVDPHAAEAKIAGVYLIRNWRRSFAEFAANSAKHFRIGQTKDIADNLAAYEKLNKQRVRRPPPAAVEALRTAPSTSPIRMGRVPDARVVMPPVSLLPTPRQLGEGDSSSDESSFDAAASAAIAEEVDIALDFELDEDDGSSVVNLSSSKRDPQRDRDSSRHRTPPPRSSRGPSTKGTPGSSSTQPDESSSSASRRAVIGGIVEPVNNGDESLLGRRSASEVVQSTEDDANDCDASSSSSPPPGRENGAIPMAIDRFTCEQCHKSFERLGELRSHVEHRCRRSGAAAAIAGVV